MKQEQRFLLALILTAGILSLWSALTPPARLPAHQPPEIATEQKPAVFEAASGEKTNNFEMGRFTIGVGLSRGGIGTLEVDHEPLLEQTVPGLLEVRWGEPHPEPVRFDNRLSDGKLLSEGSVSASGIRIQREIQPEADGSFNLKCRIRALNESKEARLAQLQVVIYLPLHASKDPSGRYHPSATLYLDGKSQAISVGRGQEKRFAKTPAWVASQGKSHVVIVRIPSGEGVFHVEHSAGGRVEGWLELPSQEIPAGQQREWEFPLYVGPMTMEPLKKAGLEEALSFGAFSGIARWLLTFLDWSYNRLHNYGLAICLLSVAVWLPFSPLTWYGRWLSTQTMRKMAAIKPQEARIRKEYKDKPDEMHRELMQLYRKHGVNPASGCIGCLPLLFTWPIYIALFQVLTRAPELRGAHFLWIRDLSGPDGLIPLPLQIPLLGARLNVLPIAATAATYFQQALMQPQDPAFMTEEQKAQQQMMKFFPLMFLVIFYQLPSGFMLYWVVNSTLTVGQQLLTDRLAKSRS